MPKIDLEHVQQTNRTGYPQPFATDVAGRLYRRIGSAGGLVELGASHVVLQPGAWSSQRHWHDGIDELVVVLEGEVVLIEDGGETLMQAGDCATFPKGVANGHHLVNRSERPCTFVAIDSRRDEGDCHYPDVDLHFDASRGQMTHKDGTPY